MSTLESNPHITVTNGNIQASIERTSLIEETAAVKLPYLEERNQFNKLLLVNPNYFGTLKESPLKPVIILNWHTFYENLCDIGYDPTTNRLDATVHVNQSYGYGGGVCTLGTLEYVHFWISYDNRNTWQDLGQVAFRVHDGAADRPLSYSAGIYPQLNHEFCSQENLPVVRTVLSWNSPSANFTTPPPFGDTKDVRIQVKPLKTFKLGKLLEKVKVEVTPEIKAVVDLEQVIAAPPVTQPTIAELVGKYQEVKEAVPAHRFLYKELQTLVKTSATDASAGVLSAASVISDYKLDLNKLLNILGQLNGNTTYEELNCLGLNSTEDRVVAVLKVKKPYGYLSGQCSSGSKEYVAFFVDWEDGAGWHYLGTNSVTVYDLNSLPPEGLEYSVSLPISTLEHGKSCEFGLREAKLHAILSWQEPPPADVNWSPQWGNHKETRIEIKPGHQYSVATPFVTAVGDVPQSDITSSGYTIASTATIQTGLNLNNSPFGGRITIAGKIVFATAGMKYRLMRKLHGAPDTTYAPVTMEPQGLALRVYTFNGTDFVSTAVTLHADANGYYEYQDYSPFHWVDRNLLGIWYSNAADDGSAFDLRVDLSVDGNPAHDRHSNTVTVMVDNTAPDVALTIDGVTGADVCADFIKGKTFTGKFKTTDANFGSYGFVIRPGGPANGAAPTHTPLATAYPSLPTSGVAAGTFSLDTSPMNPCGYSLTVYAYDRTNVNSGGSYYYNEASVGFCVKAQ